MVNVQNTEYLFGVAKTANILWGMPDILDYLVNNRCWVQAYVARKIESIPSPSK